MNLEYYMDEDDSEPFVYEADDKEFRKVLFDLMAKDFLESYRKENPDEQIDDALIKKIMISTLNLVDFEDLEGYYHNYEDEINDYFYDEAKSEYRECLYESEYFTNPMSYNGLHPSDFGV